MRLLKALAVLVAVVIVATLDSCYHPHTKASAIPPAPVHRVPDLPDDVHRSPAGRYPPVHLPSTPGQRQPF